MVQVHPGPPLKSPIYTRRFAFSLHPWNCHKNPFCQKFAKTGFDRVCSCPERSHATVHTIAPRFMEATSCGAIRGSSPTPSGGGLLIHPDPFVRTDFRLFCLRCRPPSCAESPHSQSIVSNCSAEICAPTICPCRSKLKSSVPK